MMERSGLKMVFVPVPSPMPMTHRRHGNAPLVFLHMQLAAALHLDATVLRERVDG